MISFACHSLIRRTTVALVLCTALPCGSAAAGDRPAPLPHIRAVNPELLAYVYEGRRRSPTFRALADRIERSDLVVYLETPTSMPPLTKAYTRWVGANAALRFVRVAVQIPASTEAIIALLGHELQHANEVADAADVRTEADFQALYCRIGDESPGGWDTAAARLAGRTVRDEVRGFAEPATAKPTSAAGVALPALSTAPFRR